jgi:hypothetical protein
MQAAEEKKPKRDKFKNGMSMRKSKNDKVPVESSRGTVERTTSVLQH